MESQPQNPEFMINPENFHPCILLLPDVMSYDKEIICYYLQYKLCFFRKDSSTDFKNCQVYQNTDLHFI